MMKVYIYIERSENKGASKVENFAETAGKFVFSRTNKKIIEDPIKRGRLVKM